VADWITPEDVAKYADVPYPDDAGRVDHATGAVRAAVERRRSDLDFADDTTVPSDVRAASIEWATLIYQARVAPSGFAGFSEETVLYSDNARRADIMRRLGWNRPVAI